MLAARCPKRTTNHEQLTTDQLPLRVLKDMNWFEVLTGFAEESPHQVREKITLQDQTLVSNVNGKRLIWGRLETPSLGELRQRVSRASDKRRRMSVREVIGDVQQLHASNAEALFQVASQFNLLEMAHPSVTPEEGVAIYATDHTQGPACAIAAGAGTIYRNYFADVNGLTGQSATNQIDCLADIGVALENSSGRLWKMRNGYALASKEGLAEISLRLQQANEAERDRLRQLLRIGVQWKTQVTIDGCQHLVSQAYCSALPVSYSNLPKSLWSEFARLILEASYEATMCTGILNQMENGNRRVFLTLLGGGAFGNDSDWIAGAIERAVKLHSDADLDVSIVSYGSSKPFVRELIERLQT